MNKSMKKILIAFALIGSLFTSCDMDKQPFGALDDQTAIQKLNDCLRFRNGLYTSMRSITSGSWIYTPEIQADLFQGMIGNGNNVGLISTGNILSSDQDVEAYWASMYTIINKANYLIEKTDELIANGTFTDDELTVLKRYDGEARFTRAYCYFWLADRFCQTYSSANAQSAAMGLPLVSVYYPTADRSVYPGRSTQEETYAFIAEDLEKAYTELKAFESASDKNAPAPNSAYVSSYTVQALQARIALAKGDNATALSKAEAVINSGVYSLTTMNAYANLWSKDEGTEVLFRPFMSSTELGNATGASCFLTDNEESAWYIPTQEMLMLYDEGDIRFDAFFTVYKSLKSNGLTVAAYVFNKFPGNETLKTGTQRNFVNMMKPFRLSEQYLIAAEAAANSNDATKANKYLNELRANRIQGYEAENLNGNALVKAVRTERLKELIGEGFRLSDLRRWGEGFTRDGSYDAINPKVEECFVVAGRFVSYPADDYRFVWPIPATEIQSNPQLDGQQNPGY